MISRERVTNQQLKKELLEAQRDLYSGRTNAALLETIKLKFPGVTGAYLLQWLPDQGEDIFWILIDSTTVAIIEIPRPENDLSSGVLYRLMNTQDYLKRRLSRVTKRKVELALRLMSINPQATVYVP